MAHFAELDPSNNVVRVVVVPNDALVDDDGVERENLGVQFCLQVIGPGIWKQTSFNNNFRKIFGEPGTKYAPDKDVFYNIAPPFASWTLDENYDWQPPVPYPTDGNRYWWNEESLQWVNDVNTETGE